MGHDYQYDDVDAEHQAAWNAEEAAWDERMRWRVMVVGLAKRLDLARVELMSAETALCVAIGRANKARELCSSIADAIEAAARMVQQ